MTDFRLLQKKYTVNTYPDRGLTLIRGQRMFLYDESGKKYLDMMSNYGVNIFGYGNKKIIKALTRQVEVLTNIHGSFANDVRARASEKLIKKMGRRYKEVYWSNSGAEAIEAALKFAIFTTGKKEFIVCGHGYHGKTLGALSATAEEKYKKPFTPLLWQFTQIPFNDIKALDRAVNGEVAAFIVEPIQGEGGVFVPDDGYLKSVEKICRKANILLILDEIQTGVGRTGKFLASGGVSADILCLGKGLGGGVPIGATVVNKKVAAKITRGVHTSTFGGNPLACAGVLQVLTLLNEHKLRHIRMLGKYFMSQLKEINSNLVLEVRGKGLMIGLAVKDKRLEVLKLLQQNSILAIPAGDDVVRFLPAYIIEKRHIDAVIKNLKIILKQLS